MFPPTGGFASASNLDFPLPTAETEDALRSAQNVRATRQESDHMRSPLTAPELLEREFLETRCKLLEVAAALDRIDRADGSVSEDPRREKVQRALAILAEAKADRAERLQLLFSLNYDSDWQKKFFG
jgi:hypothetical protein